MEAMSEHNDAAADAPEPTPDPDPHNDPHNDPDHEPDHEPDHDRDWARSLHDRTGEVELIISAAVLFGLFQAPSVLDRWFDTLQFRLTGTYFTATFVVWYYTKLIVYTLIGSFSVHLLTRAYWIGILGLDSAFPQGIRWDQLRYGRLTRAAYQERLSSIPTLARRADRVGSTIFAVAFWVVLLFAISVVVAAVVGGVTLALARWVIPGASLSRVWVVLMMVVALFPAAAIGVDRLWGEGLDPRRLPARIIKGTVALWYTLFAGPVLLPIQFTLFTNLPRKIAWGAMIAVFAVLMGVFVAGERFRRGDLFVSGSEFFPARTAALAVNERYYEDRDPDRIEGVPTIPSDVIRGPYVRLSIPFVARRDAARLRALCPDLPLAGAPGLVTTSDRAEPPPEESAALLACVAGLWTLAVDGRPAAPEWSFTASGGNGISGLVTYLPTAELGPGAHLLEVVEVLPADDERDPRRHFIRFWI